jgi:hypothetical protein
MRKFYAFLILATLTMVAILLEKPSQAQSAPTLIYTCQQLENIGTTAVANSQAITGNFQLANDIDCSASKTWNNGVGFIPLGFGGTSPVIFTQGTFDGAGHSISNLYINMSVYPSSDIWASGANFGLFYGTLNTTIKNLNITNATIIGGPNNSAGILDGGFSYDTILNVHVQGNITVGGQVGGLAPIIVNGSSIINSSADVNISPGIISGGLIGTIYNGSSQWVPNIISQSYSTGSINSTGSLGTGGLVGQCSGTENRTCVSIINSYSTIAINGYHSIVQNFVAGGLVGEAFGVTTNITNSYAAGPITVQGNFTYLSLGGLIGDADLNSSIVNVTNSYWDKQATGQMHSIGSPDSYGLTTAQMQKQTTFKGWDFANIWKIQGRVNYPYLSWENRQYISDCPHLQAMNQNLSGNYYLANNIDCSATNPNNPNNSTSIWNNNGAGFIPVGYQDYTQPTQPPYYQPAGNPFVGQFDGQGKTIKNLFVNVNIGIGTANVSLGTENPAGLFGSVQGSSIKNVNLENVSVTGPGQSGGLAGQLLFGNNSVRNVNVDGQVTGYWVGGLIGTSYQGNIDKSSAITNVNVINSANFYGSTFAGGLVGYSGQGTISNSISKGTITNAGSTFYAYTGGLVGEADNTSILTSYSTSSIIENISNNISVGGLVGHYDTYNSPILSQSYAAGHIQLIGTPTPGTFVGGLIGNVFGNITANDSYWDKQTTGQLHSIGSPDSNGEKTSQMQTQSTYLNWDFTNTWRFTQMEYPQLQWEPVTLTIFINGSGSGTFQSLPARMNCTSGSGKGCFAAFSVNKPLTLIFLSPNNSVISNWGIKGCSSGTSACTFSPDTNIVLNVMVNAPNTIDATAGNGGKIIPSGKVIVKYGANAYFGIKPNAGYKINQVLVDGKVTNLINGSSYLFMYVIAAHTISASFTPTLPSGCKPGYLLVGGNCTQPSTTQS